MEIYPEITTTISSRHCAPTEISLTLTLVRVEATDILQQKKELLRHGQTLKITAKNRASPQWRQKMSWILLNELRNHETRQALLLVHPNKVAEAWARASKFQAAKRSSRN